MPSAVVVVVLLAGAVVALASPSGPGVTPTAHPFHARPPWAAITLPAHHVVGPAILVGPRPLVRRLRNRHAKGRPVITSQPHSVTIRAGRRVSFTAAAAGTPTPKAQWQRSVNGGRTWQNIRGAHKSTYALIARAGENGYRFRVRFTNSHGRATSRAAKLTITRSVVGSPTITVEPANQTVLVDATANFTAAASGTPAPTVQWQVSQDRGSSWSNIAGATSKTYSVIATSQQLYEYRAVFTNSRGTTISSPATLTIAQASANWSGYATTGTQFTAIRASWTVRKVTCSGTSTTYSAQWIGIDGDGSNTVEQDGSQADCIAGSPYYGAWYEMYGDSAASGGYEVPLPSSSYPVYPGDSMTASVSVSGGSNWTLRISDATQNWVFTTTINFSGAAEASAEWIIERPTIGTGAGSLASLSDFGRTLFTNSAAAEAGTSGPISSFAFDPVEMVNSSGNPLSVPGPLDPTGASFGDTWLAAQ